jgi:hypothetical protein
MALSSQIYEGFGIMDELQNGLTKKQLTIFGREFLSVSILNRIVA